MEYLKAIGCQIETYQPLNIREKKTNMENAD